MNTESDPTVPQHDESAGPALPASTSAAATYTSKVFPRGWPQRLWFGWATVVVPSFSFAMALTELHLAEWQRGDIGVWLELLVDQPGALAFSPLAALAVTLCASLTLRPGPWIESWYSRVILMIGVLLGLQYSFLLAGSQLLRSPWPAVLLEWQQWGALLLFLGVATGISTGIVPLTRWVARRFGSLYALLLYPSLWCLASAVAFAIQAPEEFSGEAIGEALFVPAFWLLLFTLFCGPIWTTDALVRLLRRLGKPQPWPVPGLLLGLGAYLASWRLALHFAAEAYRALPPEPPNCFVVSAAAQAPPWLSGSFEVARTDGDKMRVSPQLQHFKLFELALRELTPQGHRALRRVYDRFGPKIAAHISSPARAAATHLLLRPLELCLRALLRGLLGKPARQLAARLYRR